MRREEAGVVSSTAGGWGMGWEVGCGVNAEGIANSAERQKSMCPGKWSRGSPRRQKLKNAVSRPATTPATALKAACAQAASRPSAPPLPCTAGLPPAGACAAEPSAGSSLWMRCKALRFWSSCGGRAVGTAGPRIKPESKLTPSPPPRPPQQGSAAERGAAAAYVVWWVRHQRRHRLLHSVHRAAHAQASPVCAVHAALSSCRQGGEGPGTRRL